MSDRSHPRLPIPLYCSHFILIIIIMMVSLVSGCSAFLSFEECSSDSDCAAGLMCTSDKLCRASETTPDCTMDSDCTDGQVCTEGSCAEPLTPANVAVTITLDPALFIEADLLRVRLQVSPEGGTTTEVVVPEGDATIPLVFPLDVTLDVEALGLNAQTRIALVGEGCVAGLEGTAAQQSYACSNGPKPLLTGSVEVDATTETGAEAVLGLASSCGDGSAADGVEVCFEVFSELLLGGGEEGLGEGGNGARFLDFNSDGDPDLLAAWGGDFQASPPTVSGVSLFLDIAPDSSEIRLVDDRQGGNLEVAAIDLVGRLDDMPDRDKDIVVAVRNPPDGAAWAGELKIWRGEGSNVFDRRNPFVMTFDENRPGEMQIADVLDSGEGDELLIAMRDAGELVIMGQGVDGPEQLIAPLEIGEEGRGFQVLDIDKDGDLDIVTTAKGEAPVQSQIAIHINEMRQSFTTTIIAEEDPGTRDVAVVDMNGDGRFDLATINENNGFLSIHIAESATSFMAPIQIPLFNPNLPEDARTPLEPERLRTGDVDGDGTTDLLACSREGSVMMALLDGAGGLKMPPIAMFVGKDGERGQDIQGCDVWRMENGRVEYIAAVERVTNTIRVFKLNP